MPRRAARSGVGLATFGVALVVVLYLAAAAFAETCTTDARCTSTWCPDTCDRPAQVLLATVPVLAAAGFLTRRLAESHGAVASAAPLVVVSAVAVVAMALLTT